MKKVLSKASIAVTLGLAAAAASADCEKFECANVKVVAHYTRENGDALVQFSGKPWRLGCKPARYVYVTVPASSPNFANLYAHLAAYKITEQPITVNIDAGTKECTVESIQLVTE